TLPAKSEQSNATEASKPAIPTGPAALRAPNRSRNTQPARNDPKQSALTGSQPSNNATRANDGSQPNRRGNRGGGRRDSQAQGSAQSLPSSPVLLKKEPVSDGAARESTSQASNTGAATQINASGPA